jgi:D-alanine-D-alanine ligase
MKVCVLQPDYSTTSVDYKDYDPPRDLAGLLPEHQVDHVFINKLTTYRQLKQLSRKGYDIFVNLCEGYMEWEVPGIDVYHHLEYLNLPFTGPGSVLFDVPKPIMKYVAYAADVKTPAAVEVTDADQIDKVLNTLKFPMFAKPSKAGDSLGIDENSKLNTEEELRARLEALTDEFGEVIVEEYVDGREFTVLVAGNTDGKGCTSYKPVEYIFPPDRSFKTYAMKTSELHPNCNVPVEDEKLEKKLRTSAERIFTTFGGAGYARMDFRMDKKGVIYFLDNNFTCSVFYSDGYEGSADYCLKYDPAGQRGFLLHIIEEGIARHKARQRKFKMEGNAIAGFGIFATQDIRKGEVLFSGEGMPQRVITKNFVEAHWNRKQKSDFKHYAYPLSKEVYILWDENPVNWAPQNHSCDPNTGYDGLNVIALRDIADGQELTLDYATFVDEGMDAFACNCGSPKCRGVVMGSEENTLTKRESEKGRVRPLRIFSGAVTKSMRYRTG